MKHFIIIDARFSHNCCHGMCKLGKMCKQMTDFPSSSSFYFYLFLFSPIDLSSVRQICDLHDIMMSTNLRFIQKQSERER